ncbi:MAG: lipoate--protein ligase family protein [Treponema sp.]|jgi:lipoate-protein ligase A|nr:lipoate--protein ligase family protein [Treponema sp.]
MSHLFRLFNTGYNNCYYNMGLDEALLESTAKGELPVLRFYGWKPAAVSVGYFQGLREEVDVQACRRFGFDVVRRISGGGAVFHKSELTYSIVIPLTHPLADADLNNSYRTLCAGLIEGLALAGVHAEFSGINDIVVKSAGKTRKISGNAQTRRKGCVLQHGTVLLDNDIETMFNVLKIPAEKIKGTLMREAKERVTNLRDLLKQPPSFDEARRLFEEGFKKALDLEYRAVSPNNEESARALLLAQEKFSTAEWIYKR